MNSEHIRTLAVQAISNEIMRKDYIFNDDDYETLQRMLHEINLLGHNFRYLAEIEALNIPGIGLIVEKYICQYRSETTRSYLIQQLVHNKIQGCDKLLIDLYLHFKQSDEYIAKPGMPAPAHIYVRYDNAFTRLRPKKIANNLLELIRNPRDAFYLPLTVRMLASWKIPDLEQLLIYYLSAFDLSDSCWDEQGEGTASFPSLEFMKRELFFTAVAGLKYYPSAQNYTLIEKYKERVNNRDVVLAVNKTLRSILKSINSEKASIADNGSMS